ncbi:amino acid transporter [Botrytis cinerea]
MSAIQDDQNKIESGDARKPHTPDSGSHHTQDKEGIMGETDALEAHGRANFSRLGWKRLTVILLVEAIALGALSIPGAFATLGMVAGVILTVGVGLIAIYTSHIIGQVKLAFPHVAHYADAGRLLMGRFGYELVGAMFALELTFLVGSHCLTGTIAFLNLSNNGACSVVFGVVSAIILLVLAIPPSFADVAILGYIDFVSIMAAIGITIVATAVVSGSSAGAFGVALPVIFISGSINCTVVARYIHGRVYKNSVVRFINTKKGWLTWLGLISFLTIIAWVIAEAIPFFSDLLSIMSALFVSGFTFYFPAMMWFMLIKKGKWYARENLFLSVVNGAVFVIGIVVLVGGTYAAVEDIKNQYAEGTVRGAFTCAPIS